MEKGRACDLVTMTPQAALEVLSQATEPQAAGKINREGYVVIQQAIQVLDDLIKSQPKN
jgi:hypothetical protein